MPVTSTDVSALSNAVAQFNAWRFYDCHETLEDVWLEAGGKSYRQSEPEFGSARFYQGLIKAAAGFHHVLRKNHRGAVLVLSDSLRLLEPYRPRTLGVDIGALADSIAVCLRQIEALGPDGMEMFDRGLIPQITYDPEGAR